MPYTFNLPSFIPISNLDEYGRNLLRKRGNSIIDQLFPTHFGGGPTNDFGDPGLPTSDYGRPGRPINHYGGPSRYPYNDPWDRRGSGGGGGSSIRGSIGGGGGGGSIRGGSMGSGGRNSTKGSISSLPKFKESVGSTHMIYRVSHFKKFSFYA
ncbi:hypothetical protein Phum_PHUM583440 [Pediculus humanus corporis]|uniref:Uncharacterized protein n=1 Tax=Pediculus humanus subsp. corporis TaxID=121224 RepID=E0W234_PEDHC|nr:uncharacterized protein Phum_PHUM583440 [Pediculus humanus corporis]EEB19690.1 hypothetical protein Phum_PHUM583440 [Pediculus humanus corporis]